MISNRYKKPGAEAPDIAETVYESLMGQLLPSCQLPWVENIFVEGHPCYEEYQAMYEAYARLRVRLSVTDEDADAEAMISSLLKQGKIIALKMFHYGMEYQKILDPR